MFQQVFFVCVVKSMCLARMFRGLVDHLGLEHAPCRSVLIRNVRYTPPFDHETASWHKAVRHLVTLYQMPYGEAVRTA